MNMHVNDWTLYESYDDPVDSTVAFDTDYQYLSEATDSEQALELLRDKEDSEIYDAEMADDCYDVVDVEVTEDYENEAEDLFEDELDEIIDTLM